VLDDAFLRVDAAPNVRSLNEAPVEVLVLDPLALDHQISGRASL
jgi:hypothetical protein